MDYINELSDPSSVQETPTLEVSPIELSKFHSRVQKQVAAFDSKEGKTIIKNRNKRKCPVDVDELREKGLIDKDETFIKMGVIAKNIRREVVPYVNYIVQAPRIGIFCEVGKTEENNERLDNAFSSAVKYEGYFDSFYSWIDAASLHGKSFMEVVADTSMPGGVRFNVIPAEDFIYPLNTRDIQDVPLLVIRYHCTKTKLEEYKRLEGFDVTVIDTVLKEKEDQDDEDFVVYKAFTKIEGVVYVGWMLERNNTKWLRILKKFNAGVFREETVTVTDPVTKQPAIDLLSGTLQTTTQLVPEDEILYPFFPFIYEKTEEQLLAAATGRAEADSGKQEAQCSLWSTYVNWASRSGNVYCSVDAKPDAGTKPEAVELQLENGRVYNQKLVWSSHPSPPIGLIDAANKLDVATSEDIGQISFAANNRVDSRKTATEIQSASQQNASLDSVSVVNFSTALQLIFNYAWRIVQNAASRNAISFLAIVDPTTGIEQNDVITINKRYIIKPAGDSDVIQKEQRLNNRLRIWPQLAQIPGINIAFMVDILKEMFPSDGTKYEQLLQQAQSDGKFKQISGALLQMVEAMMQMPELAQNHEVQAQQGQIEQIKKAMTE